MNLLVEFNKYANEKNFNENKFHFYLNLYSKELKFIIEKYNLLNFINLKEIFIFFNYSCGKSKDSFNKFKISRSRFETIYLSTSKILNSILDEVIYFNFLI